MPINISPPSNIILFFTILSPILISSYLILDSAFNYHIRGFIFLIGLSIIQFLGFMSRKVFNRLRPFIKFKRPPTSAERELHDMCEVFQPPWKDLAKYSSPSTHGIFHSFILAYMILGAANNPNDVGIPFILFLILIAIIDFYYRMKKHCDNWIDLFIGFLFGAIGGALWWFAMWNLNKEYTYFGTENNARKCSLGTTKFVCTNNA